MKRPSIFDTVWAPVPRYLMRLDCVRNLLDKCPSNLNAFLEIGPGLGDITAHLLQRFPTADGQLIEFSEQAAEYLGARFKNNDRINIISKNLSAVQFRTDNDLVLAFEVLEHIEDDIAAIQQIFSALRPGGLFIMSVPAFMERWEKGDEWAGHYRRYEKAEIEEKLTSVGFKIQDLWGYGFPISTLLYPARQFFYFSKQKATSNSSKQDASKQSGIVRPMQAPGWAPWLARLMAPLFFIQRAARHTNLGDGWVVLAYKPSMSDL